MDTLNHIVQGGLAGYYTLKFIGASEEHCIIASVCNAFAASIPDVAGEYYAKYKEVYNGNTGEYVYKMYDDLHFLNNYPSHIFALLFPGYLLHILQDYFLHSSGKRWWVWRERMWYAVLTWFINIFLIIILILQ